MRIASSPNLTVELIRQARFSPAPICPHDAHPARSACDRVAAAADDGCGRAVGLRQDTVVLGCTAPDSGYGRPSRDADRYRAGQGPHDAAALRVETGPRKLTPVVGSPALAGLGVALVVPGTLLDVVA